MDRFFYRALVAGGERVAAWADLLDEINVFPVADGDTGRNLKISLAPLNRHNGKASGLPHGLIASATGNSGNIAAAFLSRFLQKAESGVLEDAIAAGRQAAWQAVADPKPGTMLTVFDALTQVSLGWSTGIFSQAANTAIAQLDAAVRSTAHLLPELKQAGVVDSGALGMFLFFESVICRLGGDRYDLLPVTDRFAGLLNVSGDTVGGQFAGYCVNTVLRSPESLQLVADAAGLGQSVVAVPDGERLRLHLHTRDHQGTKARLEALGEIIDWQVESMNADPSLPKVAVDPEAVHLMTDAAGSLTRHEARQLGVTLLDSHLIVDDRSVPETLFEPQELYNSMAAGRRVSTAQASLFQKHQSYQSVLGRHDRVLYLTVGSVYTGNFAAACQWREANGVGERFAVLDTGAASGRLGLIVRLVAREARLRRTCDDLVVLARHAIESCGELLFLNQLKFLAAGGRISKSKGFFGDLLGIRPVICPAADGAVKAGTVRKRDEQVPFAVRHLKKRFSPSERLAILLQFSDNEHRVRERILPEIHRQFPVAQIEVSRLSLTSGAHMGPGTWGLAFCPEIMVA